MFHVVVEASGDRNKERKIRRKKKKAISKETLQLDQVEKLVCIAVHAVKGSGMQI